VRTNNKLSEQKTKEGILEKHLLPFFGDMEIEKISGMHIERYKAAKRADGLVEKTVNNHLTVLGKCLRTAQEWGIVEKLPKITNLKVPPVRFDFLSPEEVDLLLGDTREPFWTVMVRLAVRTGMRRGELMGLDWSDVDLERGIVTVRRSLVCGQLSTPKNNRTRYIPLTHDAWEMLATRSKSQGLVFERPDGRPLDKSVAGPAIERMCKRVGLRLIGWHTLRHTFASQLAVRGVPLPVIKDLLGHSSITMTMRYAHIAPSSLRDAIAVLEPSAPVPFLDSKKKLFGHQVGTEQKILEKLVA
jgi:integrase